MINHSLNSCDFPLGREPTLPSMGPFLVKGATLKVTETLILDLLSSLQRGCPVSGPFLAGCQWTFSEAPLSPLSMDIIPEHF